jgi:hypothetical protein
MANDRLRTAMLAAGLTVESLAAALHRDPKTVERWIRQEQRQPHRTTRVELTKLLKVREVDLWPELGGSPRPAAVETELVHLYPSRSAITGAIWTELLASVSTAAAVWDVWCVVAGSGCGGRGFGGVAASVTSDGCAPRGGWGR